ncbi:RDD family protein [Anaplasma platys]|uniref:RDD family protein n=1 Tax=Anaplasma platys TaxID=949 RepID=A0A858PY50_9RICK|nr:RDD family protein [Anaplasma platys]QJC27533.1 RDD family protein [Anaplasma platys]
MQEKIRKVMEWASNFVLYPFGRPKKYEEGELHYMSGTRRCISALIDLVLVAVVLQLVHGAFVYVFPRDEATFKAVEKYKMGGTLREDEAAIKNVYLFKVITLQAVQLVMVYLYFVYSWVKFSMTIGGFLMRIQVIDEDSLEAIGVKQATKRFLFVMLSGLPLGIGIFWSNFDPRKRAWHDMLAKTVVVTISSLEKKKESLGK